MPTAKRTGWGFIAFALFGLVITGFTPPARPYPPAKSYSLAVSGWSNLHLIELGTDWPTNTNGSASPGKPRSMPGVNWNWNPGVRKRTGSLCWR